MDILSRRDATRWSGLTEGAHASPAATPAHAAVRAQQRQTNARVEKSNARIRGGDALVGGPPLEGGNEGTAGVLTAQLAALQRALTDDAGGEPEMARIQLEGVHRYILGRAGKPLERKAVHREGDPPLPPPPAPILAIDPSIMKSDIGSIKELAPELLITAAEVAAKVRYGRVECVDMPALEARCAEERAYEC
jgi:hypothetical protein